MKCSVCNKEIKTHIHTVSIDSGEYKCNDCKYRSGEPYRSDSNDINQNKRYRSYEDILGKSSNGRTILDRKEFD